MTKEATDWLEAFDRDPDSGVLLDARNHIAALVAEVTMAEALLRRCQREVADLGLEVVELREDKAETIRKAWFASGSWTLGGMRGFKQCHHNLQEYLKQELGEA